MPEEAQKTVTTRWLSQHFQVGEERVRQLAKAGMPKVGKDEYDPHAACAWLREKREAELTSTEKLNLTQEDALLKRTQRELKELELAQKRGELIEVTRVMALWERVGVAIRNKLLTIPTKATPRLISCETEHEMSALLTQEMHEILDELSSLTLSGSDTLSAHDADPHPASKADPKPVGGPEAIPKPRGKRRTRKVADRQS